MSVLIGTAGWSIPRAVADAFPADGSGLERYAAVFGCVEVNTTFTAPTSPPPSNAGPRRRRRVSASP